MLASPEIVTNDYIEGVVMNEFMGSLFGRPEPLLFRRPERVPPALTQSQICFVERALSAQTPDDLKRIIEEQPDNQLPRRYMLMDALFPAFQFVGMVEKYRKIHLDCDTTQLASMLVELCRFNDFFDKFIGVWAMSVDVLEKTFPSMNGAIIALYESVHQTNLDKYGIGTYNEALAREVSLSGAGRRLKDMMVSASNESLPEGGDVESWSDDESLPVAQRAQRLLNRLDLMEAGATDGDIGAQPKRSPGRR